MARAADNPNQPRCPNCDALTIVYRKKTNSYMCRRCGHEWPKEGVKHEL